MTKWLTQKFQSKSEENFYVKQKEKYYYSVDKILNHRMLADGKREFLISWENYSIRQATWEPESHLDGAYSKLQNYCRDKKLTFSTIKGRVGSNCEITTNSDRYVDIESILQTILSYKNYYYKTLNIQIDHWSVSMNRDGIYLLLLKQHCYVIGYMKQYDIAYVGDGTNMCHSDEIHQLLQHTMGISNIPLDYPDQSMIDYCASSVIAIAPPMMKHFEDDNWNATLRIPISWKNNIKKFRRLKVLQ